MRKDGKLLGCRKLSGRPFLILLGIQVKKYAFYFNISSDFDSWFRYSLSKQRSVSLYSGISRERLALSDIWSQGMVAPCILDDAVEIEVQSGRGVGHQPDRC